MSFPRFPSGLLALLAAAALAPGCTPEGTFPSLAPRPIESEDPLEEPVRVPPVVAGDPQLRSRVASLLGEARRGTAALEAPFEAARVAALRAGPRGSETWVAAQQALSRAEAVRAPTTAALAELDRLLIERARIPTAAEDFAALRAARDEAEAIDRAQRTVLDAIANLIRR